MRRTFLLLFTIHLSLFAFSQSWEPVGGGIDCPDNVYRLENDFRYKDTIQSSVYTLCVYGEKLYAGGLFRKAGNVNANNIARWDGKKWDSLGSGINGRVLSMGKHKNMLIVGGSFDKAGKKPASSIARWIDTLNTTPSWYYFHRGFYKMYGWLLTGEKMFEDANVSAICDFEGNTYAGGNYGLSDDGVARSFSFWNPGKDIWAEAINLIPDSTTLDRSSQLKFLLVYNGKLYIIGHLFTKDYNATEISQPFTWDGSHYEKLAKFPNVMSWFNCAAVSDSGIYFGGYAWSDKPGMYPIVRLNNDGSYRVINCLPPNGVINSMVYYNGKLYVAGIFNEIGGKPIHNVACWDGKNWQPLGNGLTSTKKRPARINALCIYNGDLYAAGYFDHSGNTAVMNIAKFTLNRSGK